MLTQSTRRRPLRMHQRRIHTSKDESHGSSGPYRRQATNRVQQPAHVNTVDDYREHGNDIHRGHSWWRRHLWEVHATRSAAGYKWNSTKRGIPDYKQVEATPPTHEQPTKPRPAVPKVHCPLRRKRTKIRILWRSLLPQRRKQPRNKRANKKKRLPKSLLGLCGESPEPNPPSPPYPPVDEEAKPYSRRRAKGNALWSQHIRSSEQGRTQSTRQTSCDPIPRNPPLLKLPQCSSTMDRLVYQSISEER